MKCLKRFELESLWDEGQMCGIIYEIISYLMCTVLG